MLFLFIFRLLRRLFLVFVQLLQNGRFFLRLFPFLGFYRFCKVGNGNRFPRLCPLLKICNGESIQAMNDLLVPLIKEKHQSIGHIYATHAEELGCSRRTLYSYISNCVFEVRNSDLRRTVRYKKRRKPTQASAKDRFYRQGHNYEDFQNYIKEHPDINVVEMDCVEGKKGESKAILTFTFRNCNLMLMFLLEYQDQECVLEVFVWLETVLGQEAFK